MLNMNNLDLDLLFLIHLKYIFRSTGGTDQLVPSTFLRQLMLIALWILTAVTIENLKKMCHLGSSDTYRLIAQMTHPSNSNPKLFGEDSK